MWVYYGDTGRVEGDDATRTATTYDATGAMTGTRPYTADENAVADAAVADAATLTDLAARVARIEAELWPPQSDTTQSTSVSTLAALGGVWPVDGLLLDGGKTWRNVSGVPLTSAPSGFPGGPGKWTRLFVLAAAATQPPAVVSAWSATGVYKVGNLVTYSGKTYRCLQAHIANAGWTPTAAVSLWTVA